MSRSIPFRRAGDRARDSLRPMTLESEVLRFAEGSARISSGHTQVLAAASIEKRVPPFRLDSGLGWLTAEYAMLPRATQTRSPREVTRGRPSGRTSEIQRLIGRALRSVIDMSCFPDYTVTLDCDVLQADGGTRTAAITAGYVACVEALAKVYLSGDLKRWPVKGELAAISVGLLDDVPLLDLDYAEDSRAQVDLNVVATADGRIVEIQGTGEERPFERAELDQLLDLAFRGIGELVSMQRTTLKPLLEQVAEVQSRGKRRQAPPKDERELWGPPRES